MFTVRAEVAAVGVFVATVSVLGLCFVAVWPGDYHQLNESKSAEIPEMSQPYPAIHLQLDENEKASMRETVLELHGAIPEAIVKLNARLENVTPPTSEISITQNEKVITGDNTYTLSGTICAPENVIKTAEECETAATALGKRWHKALDMKNNRGVPLGVLGAPGCQHGQFYGVGGVGPYYVGAVAFNTNLDAKAPCEQKCDPNKGQECETESVCICRGTTASATGGKKLDKALRICLNTQLNELDATYETSLVDYKAKKDTDFVDGPVTQWSTAYANADADQSLADDDFLKVAAAKANFDGLFFYLKTSHTIEICDFTADEANKAAVKANPVLFNLPESQCAKAISAADDFETGAGIKLLSECKTTPTKTTTTTTTEPQRGAE